MRSNDLRKKNKMTVGKCILLYVAGLFSTLIYDMLWKNDWDFGLIFLAIGSICVVFASFNLSKLLKETYPLLSKILKLHGYCAIFSGAVWLVLFVVMLVTGNKGMFPL